MQFPSLPRWPALAAAVLAGAAQAQPEAPGAWRSAFEGYRPFDEVSVQPWRAANDNVGRIGGWRAYAREAQAPAPTPPATGSTSAPVAPTVPPPPPARTPAAGHRH
ncbi:hypothetical protein ACT80S_08240 [Ramlibacter sp. MAHUQ-53]|uniref:hypothetical protein n=1 Tax=unclassified Ramlibacter TaxID=2617605 RepID=UPI003637DD97